MINYCDQCKEHTSIFLEIKKQEKMAYVLGNEGNGMEKEIIDICDQIAYIPITTIESLNVAVAGSIMMYHFQGE